MANVYNFLNMPYTDIQILSEEDFTNINSIDLSNHVVRTDNHRWTFDINFLGGRDEDLFSTFMTHYLQNKNKTFKLTVPQHDKTFKSAVDIVGNSSSTYNYKYDPSTFGFNFIHNIVLWGKNDVDIPGGVFLNFPGDDKTYITSSYKSSKNFSGTSPFPGYPHLIVLNIFPRLFKAIPQALVTRDTDGHFVINQAQATVIHDASNARISTTNGLLQTARFRFVENTKPLTALNL